jgi:PAS domain S-box-containing protein
MRSSSSSSAERPLDAELLRRFLEASRRARIVALVNAARSERELAEIVVTELCEAYDAEIAIVLAAPAGGASPRMLATAGVAAAERATLFSHVLPGALLARVPHVQLGTDLLGLGARTLVSAPFAGAGGERGAIVLACLDDRHFDDADVGLLEGVANGAGQALERIWHAEALEREADQLRAVFEHSPVPMLVAAADLSVADVNAAACALLGSRREKLVGHLLADLVPYRSGAGLGEPWRTLVDAAGGGRIELLRADGSRVEAEVTVRPAVSAGRHLIVLRAREHDGRTRITTG